MSNSVMLAASIFLCFVLIQCKSEKYDDDEVTKLLDTSEYDSVKIVPIKKDSTRLYKSKKAKELVQLFDERDCKLFVETFPSTFSAFYELYGFSNDSPNELYNESISHITHLFNCINKDSNLEGEKVIDIATNGKWDADGVSFFQRELRSYIIKNSSIAIPVIDSKDKGEIESIYYFLLDGPVPDNKSSHEFLSDLEKISSTQHRVANKVLEQLKKESEH